MKVKAYVPDSIEMHRIKGTEKFGIEFPCALSDIYTYEEGILILEKIKNSCGVFTINLEE